MKKLNVVVSAVSLAAIAMSAPAFAGIAIVSGFSPAREHAIVGAVAGQVFTGARVDAICGGAVMHFTPADRAMPKNKLFDMIYRSCPAGKRVTVSIVTPSSHK